MDIYETLQRTGLPAAHSHFKKGRRPPYIVYIGAGQENMAADDSYYHSRNTYQVEYYFTKKDESIEARIEQILLEDGWLYTKSEDTYIEGDDVFVIYYYV